MDQITKNFAMDFSYFMERILRIQKYIKCIAKFVSNCHHLVRFEFKKMIISLKPSVIPKFRNFYNLSWTLL